MRVAVEAQEVAEELGLQGRVVHFNEGWVPFAERQNLLLDADIGVSTHFDNIETEFSFRTRILDYLWAGLPVVATGGDGMADLIESNGIGRIVPPVDVLALQAALDDLLSDPELSARCAEASRTLGQALRWADVSQPLLAFCRSPHRASDLLDPEQQELVRNNHVMVTTTRTKLGQDLRRASSLIRTRGVSGLVGQIASRLRRLAGESSAER